MEGPWGLPLAREGTVTSVTVVTNSINQSSIAHEGYIVSGPVNSTSTAKGYRRNIAIQWTADATIPQATRIIASSVVWNVDLT